MGALSSNPVLQILDNCKEIKQGVKYPEGLMQFKGDDWQAYYHCHPNNSEISHLFEEEHGHFHIFTKLAEQQGSWAHLIALSMDSMGQPLRWFTVNHWVTGEKWLEADRLISRLNNAAYMEQTSLVNKWLLVMLAAYKPEITDLLLKRDKLLEGQDKEVFLNDKEIYLLTEQSIRLEDKFK